MALTTALLLVACMVLPAAAVATYAVRSHHSTDAIARWFFQLLALGLLGLAVSLLIDSRDGLLSFLNAALVIGPAGGLAIAVNIRIGRSRNT